MIYKKKYQEMRPQQPLALHGDCLKYRLKKLLHGLGLLMLVTAMVACQTEEEGQDDEERFTLPVVFQLQTEGEGPTANRTRPLGRALPGQTVAREVFTDRVALYVYQRPIGPAYKNSQEGFMLDADNGTLVLPCIKQTTWPYLIAKGNINLRKNLEYRIIALGYADSKGEASLFGKTGNRFDHAQLQLKEEASQQYKTPEFFYGAPVLDETSKDTLFSFAQVQQGSAMLGGWLYRGVAGIEVELSHIGKNFTKIELLTDSLNTAVLLRHYDDFLQPEQKKKEGNYVLGECTLDPASDNPTAKIIGPNVLPVCSNLKIRATKEGGDTEMYPLKLRETNTTPAKSGRTIPGDGGDGTGVIPGEPDYPDPDHPDQPDKKSPYQICFKRNHYYRIKGDFTQMNNMKYVMEVVVNPYWEKDVNLPLEK